MNELLHDRLIISSIDRSSGTSERFTISFQSFYSQTSVQLIYAQIPNSIYNVNQYNDTLLINEGAGDIVIPISNGHYNITQYLSELQNQLNALGTLTYTVMGNLITNKITISSSGNFDLLFNNNQSNESYKLLGFDKADYTGTNSYITPNVFNMNYITHITVKMSAEIPDRIYGSNDSVSSFIIPIDVVFGETIQFREKDYYNTLNYYTTPTNLSHVTIGLYDQHGRPLILNGLDWECMLQFNKPQQ